MKNDMNPNVVARVDMARTAGRRAREATLYTGVGCKNIHLNHTLLAYAWDAGYSADRRKAKRLMRDFYTMKGRSA